MIPTGDTPTWSLHSAVFSSSNTTALPTWTVRQTTEPRGTASLPGYPHPTTFVEGYPPPIVEIFLGQNLELRGPYEDRHPCLRQQHGQGSLVSRHAPMAHQPIATARLKSVAEVERQQLDLCSPSRVLLGQPMGVATAPIVRSLVTGVACIPPTSRPERPNPQQAWTRQRPGYAYLNPAPFQLPTGAVLGYPSTRYPFTAGPASSFGGAFVQGAALHSAAVLAPLARAPGATLSVPVFGRQARRPNFLLLQLLWTVKVKSDLQQNRRLLLPPQLLGHHQGRDRRQHDTSMTSSGGNRGTTFLDAVNTPVGDALQAP
ncbi:hypothetical protein HPB47_023254 [Ixodes persulcatus]|uniref:Uncharacterized protein n=1 Tax=Ixodes persulcatus TaxID=34615 RepID=A0AC60Q7F1_IXOPE|nr:hypothetical protein HPB47_023254 [Ixodes persulcatus]